MLRGRAPVWLYVVTALMGLSALLLLGGGIWLVIVGGTPYYGMLGFGLLITAVLLLMRSPRALTLYAFLIVATLIWALYEAGLDWWPLAARGGFLMVLGGLLLLPWVTWRLDRDVITLPTDPAHMTTPYIFAYPKQRGILAAALAISLAVGIVSWFVDLHQVGGNLPAARSQIIVTPTIATGDWPAYGRSSAGSRYSPLAQITPANVKSLKVAWTYHTGDLRGKEGDPEETTFEVTPLKIGNRLYLCTPHQSVIALDASTGKEVWRYNPRIQNALALQHLTCRGLTYHAGSTTAPAADPANVDSQTPVPDLPIAAQSGPTRPCTAKLFMPTADGRLIALDPDSGDVCSNFGHATGQINLWRDMPNVRPGAYYSTSPPAIAGNVLIVGGTVLDNVSTKEQSGVIRGYDANTGALLWNWDAGKPDNTAPLQPGQTYTVNSPNSWSIMSVDERLGLVYIPLGNQPPDQWGGQRSESVERLSSSVVALEIASGALRWVFQTVHHDLWDYDVPAQPSLVDLTINGQDVPALVQPTKQGELFVLDRRSGKPILPVSETPAPQSAAAGDRTAPTQPSSALSYAPPALRDVDMWGATIFDQLACRIQFHRLRYEGRFTPPSTQGTLVYPGNFGVFNWGGIAVDPVRQIAFTTPTYLAFISKLVPRSDDTSLLVQKSGPPKENLPALNENFGAPFAAKLSPFTSPLGIPCQEPPWGYVSGADLTTGKIVWQHRNGTVRDLSPVPVPLRMGVPNLGGPILTAGGVAFLSGTLDYYVRAYDVTSGEELWKARLPAGGQATPMTYADDHGRQFLLVCAGGHGSLGTKSGDAVIAYALPN